MILVLDITPLTEVLSSGRGPKPEASRPGGSGVGVGRLPGSAGCGDLGKGLVEDQRGRRRVGPAAGIGTQRPPPERLRGGRKLAFLFLFFFIFCKMSLT